MFVLRTIYALLLLGFLATAAVGLLVDFMGDHGLAKMLYFPFWCMFPVILVKNYLELIFGEK